MRFNPMFLIFAALAVAADAAAETKPHDEQPTSFKHDEAARPPAEEMPDFESKGFKVTYRAADGKELSKAEFQNQLKDQEVSMRVDGDRKTVEITIGGELPAELQVPLAVAPGQKIPATPLVDSHGARHEWPRADGRYTVLDFYFSTCGPCIQAIPELNAFAAQRRDIAVLALTFDSVDESRRFVEARKLAWDVVPEAREFIDALGVTAYPTYMRVDPSGRLVAVRDIVPTGSTESHESLEAWVSRTLALAK